MHRYLIRDHEGRESGPHTSADLAKMVRSGHVAPNCMIRRVDGAGRWHALSEVMARTSSVAGTDDRASGAAELAGQLRTAGHQASVRFQPKDAPVPLKFKLSAPTPAVSPETIGAFVAIASVVGGHLDAMPRGVVAAGLVVATVFLASGVRASWTGITLHSGVHAGQRSMETHYAYAVRYTACAAIVAWLAVMETFGVRPALEGVPYSWIFWWMSHELPRPSAWSAGLLISFPLGWGISSLVSGSWPWGLAAAASFTTSTLLVNEPQGWVLGIWPSCILTMIGLHYSCPSCGHMVGLKEQSRTLVSQRNYSYTTEKETSEIRHTWVFGRRPHERVPTYHWVGFRTPVRIIRERTGIISTFLHRFRCRRCGFKTERMSSSNS